jgi:hypothetical protein
MPRTIVRHYRNTTTRRILLAILCASHISASYAQPPTVAPDTNSMPPAIRDCCACIYDDRYPAQIQKFIAQCSKWQREPGQRHCNVKQNVALSVSTSSTQYIPNCDLVSVEYKGHTTEADEIIMQAEACLTANPNCTLYKYNSTGCSVFADKRTADTVALNIQQLLPAGCKAEVSAHQCNVLTANGGDIVTSTKTQYLIDQQGISCIFPPCNAVPGRCDPSSGNTAFSCLIGNVLVTQSCCNIRGVGQWLPPGQPCPRATIPPMQ